jgi:hypothetical protein
VNDPPVCSLAQPSVASLWPPNHKFVLVSINSVADPNDDTVTVSIIGVTQDEPVRGLGDGDTAPDAVVQGQDVLIRAERSATGDGRVYRVSFQADDGDASCTGTVNIAVSHDRNGTAIDSGGSYSSIIPY